LPGRYREGTGLAAAAVRASLVGDGTGPGLARTGPRVGTGPGETGTAAAQVGSGWPRSGLGAGAGVQVTMTVGLPDGAGSGLAVTIPPGRAAATGTGDWPAARGPVGEADGTPVPLATAGAGVCAVGRAVGVAAPVLDEPVLDEPVLDEPVPSVPVLAAAALTACDAPAEA
jgi:hypothetical protein